MTLDENNAEQAMTGRLYIAAHALSMTNYQKYTLEVCREAFPMVDKNGKPIYSETLKWFAEWFGDEEKIKAVLDGYFTEYLATHL